jgi:hypothetical protein
MHSTSSSLEITTRSQLHSMTLRVIRRCHNNPEKAVLKHLAETPSLPLLGGYLFRSTGQNGNTLFMGYDRAKWLREIDVWKTFIDFDRTQGQYIVLGSNDPQHTLPRIFAELPQERICLLGFQQPDNEIISSIPQSPEVISLVGYASAIRRVAEWQKEGLLNLTIRGIFTCSDSVTPADQELFRELWATPARSLLSCTEVGTIATSCPHGYFHLLNDRHLVIHDNQVLCSETTEDTFLNYHIKRYPLPFACTLIDRCPCGRNSQVFTIKNAREVTFLTISDREQFYKVHPIAIRSALDGLAGINSLTIKQSECGAITIFLTGKVDITEAQTRLNQALSKLMPQQLHKLFRISSIEAYLRTSLTIVPS